MIDARHGPERLPLGQLDFLYTPSRDVVADARYYTGVLGGRMVLAVAAMGARVAMVQLSDVPPHILLTDHLEGDQPVLIYRVDDLAATLAALEARGWQRTGVFEIPHGPCTSFTLPGGQRIAVYQATRPEATEHFAGRFDFLAPE